MQKTSEFLTDDAVSRFNVRRVPKDTVVLSFKLTIGRVVLSDMPLTTNEAIAHFNLSGGARINERVSLSLFSAVHLSLLGSTSSIATAVNSVTIRADADSGSAESGDRGILIARFTALRED